jgi:hypothetical protein
MGAMAQTKYCPKTFNVVERDNKKGYALVPKELDLLFCTNKFEGEHFKVVHSTEDVAISFDHENKDLVKKAANVYYHLTIARNYWINTVKSEFVTTLPQTVIRLDITNAFSSTRHYKNAEQEKNYNNAWTIPGGSSPSFAREKISWNKEIWFSPMKKIETSKQIKSYGNNPVHESLLLVKDPVTETIKASLINQGLALTVAPSINESSLLTLALKRLGTLAVLYGTIEVTKHMDRMFMNKYYYIDTAMVPEIIYHEFAHIAMSDTMKTVHSVPVIEGMADFFAATIANRRRMYQEMKEISNNKSKDLKNRSMYHPYLEGSWNATSDFTVSLLWQGRTTFEEMNEQRIKRGQTEVANYDDLVHKSHFHLNENSDIANDLTGALINACKESCTSLRTGVNALQEVFEKKGLN